MSLQPLLEWSQSRDADVTSSGSEFQVCVDSLEHVLIIVGVSCYQNLKTLIVNVSVVNAVATATAHVDLSDRDSRVDTWRSDAQLSVSNNVKARFPLPELTVTGFHYRQLG